MGEKPRMRSNSVRVRCLTGILVFLLSTVPIRGVPRSPPKEVIRKVSKITQQLIAFAICGIGLAMMIIGPLIQNMPLLFSGIIACIISLFVLWLVTKD